MALYPVIMCGGAGTRLWPASRPSRPKQFIPLAGNRSLFQETALRVAPLAADGGVVVVVAGVSHRPWILEQLGEVGLLEHVQVLLEPEAKDSAAAMAAAALWTQRHDPHGVNVFVASDHHVPDDKAFRKAAIEAAEGARLGRIVTLGIRPTEPSTAYGYISAQGEGLSPVSAFREKPDTASAVEFIRAGYLWNSGNFIVQADVLVQELKAYAPGVEDAARRALAPSDVNRVAVLGEAFRDSPKISIDYAVMEKTERASVLPVTFDWSDLGAWDSIAATGEGEFGQHIFEDAERCLVRAPEGVLVGVLGVSDLAIIAERDAVLVCDLSRAQDVKKLVARVKVNSPRHLDFEAARVESLADGGHRFAEWLRCAALPLWATTGQDAGGGFVEALGLDGRIQHSPRRARVQARQIWSYVEAGRLGWEGPWLRAVEDGCRYFEKHHLNGDGLCRTLLNSDGSPLDETVMVYDQAFSMLALSAARRVVADGDRLEEAALRMRRQLSERAHPRGGYVEAGKRPYQANPHMHLLEACLAWQEAGGDSTWLEMADGLVDLALSSFIDARGGFLREFFDADWRPAEGEDGRLVEPGHQFEWAWLLARYAVLRERPEALRAAERLYDYGLRGVDERTGITLDALNDDGRPRGGRARLWPQTEWLKAALKLSEVGNPAHARQRLKEAEAALGAISLYLLPFGLWRDKRLSNGGFIEEPAPASSFYHVIGAYSQLQASADRVGPAGRLRL